MAYREVEDQTDQPPRKLPRHSKDEVEASLLDISTEPCPNKEFLRDADPHMDDDDDDIPFVPRENDLWSVLANVRLQRRQSSRSSDDSDSDTCLDDLDTIHPTVPLYFGSSWSSGSYPSFHRIRLTPLYSSASSRWESPRARLQGKESKSGPVCLMGDRVVIHARGPEIDRVCYYPDGMSNPTGTLCYMNSVLQAMGVLPLLAVGVAIHSPDLEFSLLNALRGLYGKMWYPAELDTPESEERYLDNRAVRSYLKHNTNLFPENLEHDVEELFLYIVDTLERETASLGLGSGDKNLVTRIFRGWTQQRGTAPKEPFYSLRLAVHDNRIHSLSDALYAHLSAGQSLERAHQSNDSGNTMEENSSSSGNQLNTKFSVSIDSLNPNSSLTGEVNSTTNDCDTTNLDTSKVDAPRSPDSESIETSSDPVSESPVPSMVIQPPEVLCLCLDRNYIDYEKGSVVYDSRPIAIDEEIIIGTAYLPEGTQRPYKYQLRSVISYRYHSWGSGHYVAGTLLGKRSWAMCDDCTVTPAKGPTLCPRGNLSSFMHFYVRVA